MLLSLLALWHTSKGYLFWMVSHPEIIQEAISIGASIQTLEMKPIEDIEGEDDFVLISN